MGKNIIVLFPLVFLSSQEWVEGSTKLIVVFGLLCLSASSVYLINDSVDCERDRLHPTKCMRPIAAGQVPVRLAICIAVVFMTTAIVGGSVLGDYPLAGALGLYLMASTAYTFLFKHFPIVDVLGLAGLYAIRLLTGFIAVSVFPTGWPWMLMVVWGGALGLALSKRWTEAHNVTTGSRRTLAFYRSGKTSIMFYTSAVGAILSYLFGAASPHLPDLVVYGSGLAGGYLMHRYWCAVRILDEDTHPQELIARVVKQELSSWRHAISRAVTSVTTLSLWH